MAVFSLYVVAVVIPGSGAEAGASDNGAGEAGQRAGHQPPSRHEMPARIFPRQKRGSGSILLLKPINHTHRFMSTH